MYEEGKRRGALSVFRPRRGAGLNSVSIARLYRIRNSQA
jgi:hypothetical protein